MSQLVESVQEYIDNQPNYTWRRNLLQRVLRILFFMLTKVTVTGAENVPNDVPAILMMNHTSFIDPIVCMAMVQNRFVIPMSKAENLQNPLANFGIRFWGAYIVKRDEVDRAALINSIELLKSGQLILIAPEGSRHPEGLAEPKDGLAYIATKADAVIIPAALANARSFPRDYKKFQRPHIYLHLGKPFRFQGKGKRVNKEERAQMMQEAMYQLALAIPQGFEEFRGAYHDVENATTELLEFLDIKNS